MNNHDEILYATGGFGLYQCILFIWWQTSVWVFVPNMGFMIFGGVEPDPDCVKAMNDSFGYVNTSDCYKYYSVVAQWDLPKHITATMTSLQMAGVFFGLLISGQISDTFGRKKTYLGFFTALAVCGLASGFSNSWQLFMFWRLIIGLAIGGGISVHFIMYQEMILTKHRLIIFVGGWPLAYMIFGGVAFFVQTWGMLAIVMNLLAIFPLALGIFWLTESPRWLVEKGRHQDAQNALRFIARMNRVKSMEPLELIFKEFEEKLLAEEKPQKYSYWHLFPNRKIAVRTCAMLYSWLVIATAYYAILLNIGSLVGNPALNVIILAAVRCFLNTTIPILDHLIPCMGRRLVHQIGLVGLTLTFVAEAVVASTDGNRIALLATAIIATAFCVPTWQSVEIYTAEIFPTALRTMGNSLCSAVSRFGSGFAPYLLVMAADFWPPLKAIVFAVFLALNLVVAYFFLPETKGKPLIDMAQWEIE